MQHILSKDCMKKCAKKLYRFGQLHLHFVKELWYKRNRIHCSNLKLSSGQLKFIQRVFLLAESSIQLYQ